ncbi:hypothetical protein [Paenibacillus sp. TH7-28]
MLAHRISFVFYTQALLLAYQIELWFRIFACRLIKRSSFMNKLDLQKKLFQFIDYFNATIPNRLSGLIEGNHLFLTVGLFQD